MIDFVYNRFVQWFYMIIIKLCILLLLSILLLSYIYTYDV